MTTIQLPLFDLKSDKVEQAIKHEIELHVHHLKWSLECFLTQLPRDGEDCLGIVKHNQYINQTDIIVKSAIVGMETYYCNDNDVWVLKLMFNNWYEDCKFETESQMRYVEAKLIDWLFMN